MFSVNSAADATMKASQELITAASTEATKRPTRPGATCGRMSRAMVPHTRSSWMPVPRYRPMPHSAVTTQAIVAARLSNIPPTKPTRDSASVRPAPHICIV